MFVTPGLLALSNQVNQCVSFRANPERSRGGSRGTCSLLAPQIFPWCHPERSAAEPRDLQFARAANLSVVSSRAERSGVEGPAVCSRRKSFRGVIPSAAQRSRGTCSLLAPQIFPWCHPERSAAESRDLQFARAANLSVVSFRAQRSEAEEPAVCSRRKSFRGVIPSAAQRSRGTCSSLRAAQDLLHHVCHPERSEAEPRDLQFLH